MTLIEFCRTCEDLAATSIFDVDDPINFSETNPNAIHQRADLVDGDEVVAYLRHLNVGLWDRAIPLQEVVAGKA